MELAYRQLSGDEIEAGLRELKGWVVEGDRLAKSFQFDTYLAGADFVAKVAHTADAMDHHPDVSREPDSLVFRLWTHSEDGVTTKDVDLAARVDQVLSGSATDTGTTA